MKSITDLKQKEHLKKVILSQMEHLAQAVDLVAQAVQEILVKLLR